MIRKVDKALKSESRKGDFVDQVQKDIEDIKIDLSEEDIKNTSIYEWEKYGRKRLLKVP